MAIDLRFILAVIKINGDLERIGDQSMGIARRTKEILKHGEVDLPVDFAAMGEFAGRMIRSAVQSLQRGANHLPGKLAHGGKIHRQLDRVQRQHLLGAPRDAHGLIADHASNIATDVIFWIRGADVRHQLSMSMD